MRFLVASLHFQTEAVHAAGTVEATRWYDLQRREGRHETPISIWRDWYRGHGQIYGKKDDGDGIEYTTGSDSFWCVRNYCILIVFLTHVPRPLLKVHFTRANNSMHPCLLPSKVFLVKAKI